MENSAWLSLIAIIWPWQYAHPRGAKASANRMVVPMASSMGSFYHLFATKVDLGLAMLDAFFERNNEIVKEAPDASGDARARALALADHLVSSAGAMWGGGCLLGTFALELAETNPTVAATVSAKFRKLASTLAEGFAPLAEAGEGDGAAQLAEEFIVAVEGSLILARAHSDWGYVDRALARFRRSAGIAR